MSNQNYFLLFFILISLTSCNTGYEVDGKNVYYNYWNEGSGSNTVAIDDADYKSFKELDHSKYAKDKNFGFYEGKTIKGIDSKSFISLLDYYAKDNNHAYYEKSIIDGANGKTFEIINEGPYSRDGKDYFYDSIKLHVNDYRTFKILDEIWSIDKTSIYVHSESSIKLYSNKYPLFDYKSFKLLTNGYAKDNLKVYYYGEVVEFANPRTFQTIDLGKGKDDKYIFYDACKIDDPKSLKKLNSGYFKDKISVYFQNKRMVGANPISFKIITENWSKDSENIFLDGKKVNSIDYNSFKYLKGKYAKDNKNLYYLDSIVVGADLKSVKIINSWDWIKDSKSYFFNGKKILGIDYNSFEILKNDYSKDKNHVYFQLKKVINADPNTFTTTDYTYGGRDKNGTYYMGKKE